MLPTRAIGSIGNNWMFVRSLKRRILLGWDGAPLQNLCIEVEEEELVERAP